MLDAFKEKWAQRCGSAPQIHHCSSAYDVRRGYGLTVCWLLCLERANAMDFEVTVIFEDDDRISERAASLTFCDAEKRRNLSNLVGSSRRHPPSILRWTFVEVP